MGSVHVALAVCVIVPIALFGERPTIFPLTTAQGLISNSGIFSIEQDSQGYLWIATHEGVSRFDGSEFRNVWRAIGREFGAHCIADADDVKRSRE